MIEKLQKALDVGGHAGALLTDLFKVFDYVDYELLQSKRNAYGLDSMSL